MLFDTAVRFVFDTAHIISRHFRPLAMRRYSGLTKIRTRRRSRRQYR
ncbi:hypothetical protein [Neisseria sicca]